MAGWEDPEHRLDADRLRELFVSLDSQIGLRRDTSKLGKLDFVICGGAVMCFQLSGRGTGDVDIMYPQLSPDVTEAVRTVARRRGIAPQWFNDGPARFANYGIEFASRLMHEGEHTRFWAPDNSYLLGMKVQAARAEDTEDALWLLNDVGAHTSDELHGCAQRVAESIGSTWEPDEQQAAFVEQCASSFSTRVVESSIDALKNNPTNETPRGFFARWRQWRATRRESMLAQRALRTVNGTSTEHGEPQTSPLHDPVAPPPTPAARCGHFGKITKTQCVRPPHSGKAHRYR